MRDLSTNPKAEFVKAYFEHQKPSGYNISKLFYLHTPALSEKFIANLDTIEEQAKT